MIKKFRIILFKTGFDEKILDNFTAKSFCYLISNKLA